MFKFLHQQEVLARLQLLARFPFSFRSSSVSETRRVDRAMGLWVVRCVFCGSLGRSSALETCCSHVAHVHLVPHVAHDCAVLFFSESARARAVGRRR